MSDVENVEVVETPENVAGTVETPEQNKPKTFSQEELNKTVQERVRREKEAGKKAVDELQSQLTEKDETITQYEKILGGIVSKQIGEYPAYVQSLLEKLSLLERISWLADEKNKISKKEFPQRKPAEGKLEETPKPQIKRFM